MTLHLGILLQILLLTLHPSPPAEAKDLELRCNVEFTELGEMIRQKEQQVFSNRIEDSRQHAPHTATPRQGHIEKLVSELPDRDEARLRQARDLLSLRAAKDQGRLVDPAQLEQLEVLETLNHKVGLIPADTDGPQFLQGVVEFAGKRPAEKVKWLRGFARSKHPDAEKGILHLLYTEEGREVRGLLRQIAAFRDFKVDYRRIRTDLLRDLAGGPQAVIKDPVILRRELRNLPDHVLANFLATDDILVQAGAAEGIHAGRPIRYLAEWTDSPSVDVRVAAVDALAYRFTPEALELLGHVMANERTVKVRVHALQALARRSEPGAAELIDGALKGRNPELREAAQKAMNRFERQITSDVATVAPPFYLRQGPSSLQDKELLHLFLEGDQQTALGTVDYLRNRPTATLAKALRSDEAVRRQWVAQQLSYRDGPEDARLFEAALADPVAEVRMEAVTALSKRDGYAYRTRLRRVADEDPDPEVRRHAEDRMVLAQASIDPGRSGQGASLETLHDLADRDFNPEVRRLAQQKLVLTIPEWAKDPQLLALPRNVEAHRSSQARLLSRYGQPSVRENDLSALAAASHVYDAPEFERAKDALDLVQQHKRFLATVPPDYKVRHLVTDPATGLKIAIYEPLSYVDKPVIVSIAGTQTRADRLSDVNLGVAQAQSQVYLDMVKRLANEIEGRKRLVSLVGAPMRHGREIVVTGHSLGGGLAQVLGHDVIMELLQRGHGDAFERVRVVTWNGFGGKQPLRRLHRYTEAVADRMRATNYYMPLDVVSGIGEHIGENIKLSQVNEVIPMGPYKAHLRETLKAAVEKADWAKNAVNKTPYSVRLARYFSRLMGPLADRLQALRFRLRGRKQAMEMFAEARLIWAHEEEYKHVNPDYAWGYEDFRAAIQGLTGEERRAAEEFRHQVESRAQALIQARQRVLGRDEEQAPFQWPPPLPEEEPAVVPIVPAEQMPPVPAGKPAPAVARSGGTGA